MNNKIREAREQYILADERLEHIFEQALDQVERLEAQLEWIVAKLKTLHDYHAPTDRRDRDGEIKGWMHVLCSSHESLHRWLKEFKETKKETRIEVERLTTDLALLKAERDGYILAVANRERECRELDDAKRKYREALGEAKRLIQLDNNAVKDMDLPAHCNLPLALRVIEKALKKE